MSNVKQAYRWAFFGVFVVLWVFIFNYAGIHTRHEMLLLEIQRKAIEKRLLSPNPAPPELPPTKPGGIPKMFQL